MNDEIKHPAQDEYVIEVSFTYLGDSPSYSTIILQYRLNKTLRKIKIHTRMMIIRYHGVMYSGENDVSDVTSTFSLHKFT